MYDGFDRFFQARIALLGLEQANPCEEELAVEFQNLEQLGGNVRSDDVFYPYPGGLFFPNLCRVWSASTGWKGEHESRLREDEPFDVAAASL